MRELTFAAALNEALFEEMERDESVVVLGQDVAVYGGVFGVTRGLMDKFGAQRVVDTPISENGMVGAAVGMAMSGLRPVVEIMYADFLSLALDSLANLASVFSFVHANQLRIPLVVRTQGGTGSSAGPQHSKSLEAWTAHIPQLHTVMPANAADAKGLLKSAIRSDEPVVFLEHRLLYQSSCHVEDDDSLVPLGTAQIVRPGEDVTICALSRMVSQALEAANQLEREGISVEVIDIRSLRPIDTGLLVGSARRTGRVVVIAESWLRYGPTAEIAALITESAFADLQAPVRRLGALGVPVPASPVLEAATVPDLAVLLESVRALAKG